MRNTTDIKYLEYLESFLTPARREKFEAVLGQRTKHFTVAMEDIFQLHNTSAVMRSCEVFGIQELNVVEERYGKAIDKEIAMGAQKWVDVNRYSSIKGCIADLKAKAYRIIATSPHEDSCMMEDFDVSQPAALFFTESLNISSSAAIILQNLSSRLRQSDVKWQLTEEEMLEKRIDWARKSIKDIDFVTARYLEESV